MWRSLAIRSALFAAVSLVLGIALGGGLAAYQYRAAGPGEESVVLFERGESVSTIAKRLQEQGAIRSGLLFRIGVRLQGKQGDLKAGEYRLPAKASMAEIADILVAGKSIQHPLTIAEGLTVAQALLVIAENELLAGEITLAPEEGRLLPETYMFTRGATRDDLIRRMGAAQEALVAELWRERADELPLMSVDEAIILASIVEKETALPEERGRIAAVFINRLNRGMRLESDPTIIYGLTGGEPLGRGLRRSELRKPTPYNTYVIDRLPPTPIANPGADSLRAVLNPPISDDLFFVADGTGGHVFAKTYAEHRQNVAKWRQLERER